MEVLFGTGTWQHPIGYIVLKEEQRMGVAKLTHSPFHILAIVCKAGIATREEIKIKRIFMTLLQI